MKLLDFGIAKLANEEAGGARTRTGVVMGTPAYMSPEQCRGAANLDHRADLYSLGCILYEMLAGRPPFNADSAGDIIAHHLYFQPEPVRLHEPSVPESTEQLVMSLLSKEPSQRPANATDVVATLNRLAASTNRPSHVAAPPASSTYVANTAPARIVASAPTTLSGSASSGSAAHPSRRVARIAGVSALTAAGIVVTMIATRQPSIAPSRATTDPAPPEFPLIVAPMRAAMERFNMWAQHHDGAPCPDADAISVANDPWGHPPRVTCVGQPVDQRIGLVSAGADGVFGTQDDVTSWQLGREVTEIVRGPRWIAKLAAEPPALRPAPNPTTPDVVAGSNAKEAASVLTRMSAVVTTPDTRNAPGVAPTRPSRAKHVVEVDAKGKNNVDATSAVKAESKPIDNASPGSAKEVEVKPARAAAINPAEVTTKNAAPPPADKLAGLSPSTAAGPEKLDKGLITRGVASVRERIIACGAGFQGVRVSFSVIVSPTGEVTSVTIKDSPDSWLSSCISSRMKVAHFASTRDGGAFNQRFSF